ncbi:MAG TPA: hypothetical protein VN455_01750 [Methanotrichaceae archaeon]|nr:hypothetical protein [Methanotrichaceae archaeon]
MNDRIAIDQMQNPGTLFDLSKARFDLSLDEAFSLTEVRSLDGYQRLKKRLPELRGSSYFFINVLDGVARLMMTVIVADGQTVTTSMVLDHQSLGISYDQLMTAARRFGDPRNGNFPLSEEIELKLKSGMKNFRPG